MHVSYRILHNSNQDVRNTEFNLSPYLSPAMRISQRILHTPLVMDESALKTDQ
jgi:hypothetical protein